MTINGANINPMSFLQNININSIPEEPPIINKALDFTECNISSQIPNRFATSRFNDFNGPEFKEELREAAINPNSKNIFIFGPTGTGKTHLLISALHERYEKNLSGGYYFNIRNLLPKLRSTRSFSSKETEEMFLQFLCKIPLLCLDEVGTCPNSQEEIEFLSTVYFCRHDNMLPTWTATNYSAVNFKLFLCGEDTRNMNSTQVSDCLNKLEKTHPILDRIKSNSKGYNLLGDSFRGK